ncbi:MAG TPA: hypothetical protein DIT25_02445 [Candidatus Moranbacteria bacterium]|nr:hypothetical protein [Candidatus Moranbacteria bacterium]
MREDKEKATSLRKKGFSYNQIRQKLGIPKSTLSYWLRDLHISEKSRGKILARAHRLSIEGLMRRNKNQTKLANERATAIRKEAKGECLKLMEDRLFMIGLSLYWAEGYKKGANGSKWKSISFANSDPAMIRIMMKFFRKFLGITDSKIKIQLIAHKNINIDEAVIFWSDLTKISKEQFIKSFNGVNKSSKGKRNPNSLTHGTVHIRINDVKLFFRLIGWIDGLKGKI